MTTTTPTNPFPNVPHPAGAVQVEDWTDLTTDRPYRFFVGHCHHVDRDDDTALEVMPNGVQWGDGTVDRVITVVDGDTRIELLNVNPAGAVQLARALMAAADDFDRLT